MSRKQKAYRAWYHKADTEDMNVQTAFAAGWDAHKGVAHARIIQELRAEIERLRDLLKQAAAELAEYIHAEHVSRHRYPDIQRRYERDMTIVREINAAIDAARMSDEKAN